MHLRKKDWEKGSAYVTPGSHWWYDFDIKGKTVLLHYSKAHGFGDVITYMRYANHLKKAGAQVIIQTRPTLTKLLSECAPYIDKAITLSEKAPETDYVFQGSPVLKMVCEMDKLKNDTPYIVPKDSLVLYWKERLQSDKNFKVGICWESVIFLDSSDRKIINPRNILLETMLPLLRLPGVSFYSLQKLNGAEQVDQLPTDVTVHDFKNDLDGSHGCFMDTLALMKNLDLVITIDTSVAHLAGAAGITTWTMIPYASCWRWFDDNPFSSLYPTMRLFRQPKYLDWESVIDQIKQELIGCVSYREPSKKSNEEYVPCDDRLLNTLDA